MAKTHKLSLRVDEETYQLLAHAAKARDMSLSEYIRLLVHRSAELGHAPMAANLGIMDYTVDLMLKDLTQELARWRRYWREHPEKLLQVPVRPPEEGP